jgi:hypothetical protein
MRERKKVQGLLFRSGNGRSTTLQTHNNGVVALSFRRPIQREHVENGCLVNEQTFHRDGTKRVAVIALDETSAESAYFLLKKWYEQREQTQLLYGIVSRALEFSTGKRSFFSRLFR